MDDYDVLLDLPSPSNALPYMYHDTEIHLESSASASPMDSPYDFSYHGAYPPSPEHTDGSGETNQSEASQQATSKPAAKRKRENRYKNAPPSVLSRRRAQNRASQRAYRERKDQRIKDLEDLLNEARQKNDGLNQAYATLQAEYIKLKSEQDATAQFQPLGLDFDPTMGTTPAGRVDMDIYIYNDATRYNM
ncbi:hypothetical protein BJ170DRAFT_199069 [Xylariales sp. AK1849]|nr:hypothetical protein BJ170DRAFT_199069 [Xylariales sp. AK1849]